MGTLSTLSNTATIPTEEEAYAIALESYFYFYPMMSMEATRKQCTNLPVGARPGFGPANLFSHMRAYPEADFRAVVRPNFDTLYSVVWLDLRQEPQVVTTPDTKGRYYLLPMLDMWSDVFAAPGWRTSGTKEQKYLITTRGFQGNVPKDLKVIEAPTPFVWVIGRIKTDGPSDYGAVHAIQDGLHVTPLSAWGKKAPEIVANIDDSIDMKKPPLETVNEMPAAVYFSQAAELLKLYAPHATDWSIINRMSRLGLVPGESFNLAALPEQIQKAVAKATTDALKTMVEKTTRMGSPVNGWLMNTESMGVYGNNYMKRAIVAMVGLGANQPEDAIYPLNYADSEGRPIEAQNNYVLHFKKEELPPVNAFWSLTLYDKDGFQCANSLNRFAISSWMPLVKNSDGSLDIYVQNANPGKDKEANWLPAPAGGVLGLTMRLYAPKPEALNGDWQPPSIKKV